jgi:hypothetical protein
MNWPAAAGFQDQLFVAYPHRWRHSPWSMHTLCQLNPTPPPSIGILLNNLGICPEMRAPKQSAAFDKNNQHPTQHNKQINKI